MGSNVISQAPLSFAMFVLIWILAYAITTTRATLSGIRNPNHINYNPSLLTFHYTEKLDKIKRNWCLKWAEYAYLRYLANYIMTFFSPAEDSR